MDGPGRKVLQPCHSLFLPSFLPSFLHFKKFYNRCKLLLGFPFLNSSPFMCCVHPVFSQIRVSFAPKSSHIHNTVAEAVQMPRAVLGISLFVDTSRRPKKFGRLKNVQRREVQVYIYIYVITCVEYACSQLPVGTYADTRHNYHIFCRN